MKTKLLKILTALLIVSLSLSTLTACGDNDSDNNQEVLSIYNMYVVSAQDSGVEPLSYEDWLSSIKGEKGDKGDKGDTGAQGLKGDKGDKGDTGAQGVGIDDIYVADNGDVMVKYTNSNEYVVVGNVAPNVQNESLLKFAMNEDNQTVSVASIGMHFENSVVIPSIYRGYPVTGIADRAFYNCSSLTSIEIPNSVTSIGEEAFYGCSSLTSIEIPEGVTSIGNSTFSSCSSLTSIVIPNSITSIANGAFSGCSSLNGNVKNDLRYLGNNDNPYLYLLEPTSDYIITAIIDEDCKFIRELAFLNCHSIVEVINNSPYITVEKGSDGNGCIGYYALSVFNAGDTYVNKFTTDASGYVTYSDGSDKILVGHVGEQTELTLPSNINKIRQYAFFNNTKITSVVIPNSVTDIGESAFCGCSSLTSIEIPESVTIISDYAFCRCSSLTSIKIHNKVTSIGEYAFYNCSSLTSIEIPESVTSIGEYAFRGCDKLTIYCVVDSEPNEWDIFWNENCPVVWGYKG